MEITTTRRKEYMKEYREQNKEQISEYQKALYEKNRAQRMARQRAYNERSEAYRTERLQCPHCNSIVQRCYMTQHKRSAKCQARRFPQPVTNNTKQMPTYTDPVYVTAAEIVACTTEIDNNKKRYKKLKHLDVDFVVDLLTTEKRCCYTDCNRVLQCTHIGPDKAMLERKDKAMSHRKSNVTLACFNCASQQKEYYLEPTRSQCSWQELADLDISHVPS